MLAVALGLASGIAWGGADFIGGLKARELPVLAVVLASQAVGLVAIVAVVAARGQAPPGGEFALYAMASGAVGVCGLAAFYRALAVGAMSVVAPISATAAIIPVAVGVASGERPSTWQGVGVALALGGVALAAREGVDRAADRPRIAAGVGLALITALAFGGFFVFMDAASTNDPFWASLVNRATSVGVVGMAVVLTRTRVAIGAGNARVLAAVGCLDISANVLYAAASKAGPLSLVAVPGSLYPVTTIVLARFVLHERLRAPQRAGVAGALAGVALIAAG